MKSLILKIFLQLLCLEVLRQTSANPVSTVIKLDCDENCIGMLITSISNIVHKKHFITILVDGTHIEIRPPVSDAEDYCNIKGWYSTILIALVDHR